MTTNRLISFLVTFTAIFFGRFLGSEGTAIMTTPASFFLFFIILALVINLIIVYKAILCLSNLSTKKKKMFLFFIVILIYVLVVCLSHLMRFLILERILAFVGVTATFSLVFWVSSDSSGGENSLPPLESSSSSESLNTFRHVLAADYENTIYNRIRTLENGHFYNIPPQTRPGEYESIVRQHFDQAITVDHLRSAMDMEYNEVHILEKKALLQERLHSLMITERNIDRIMRLSPYDDIRKEAYQFLQYKVEPVNALNHPFQRHIMEGSLHSFINQLPSDEGVARQSEFYREFYRHFTDEEFRRSVGLPLP